MKKLLCFLFFFIKLLPILFFYFVADCLFLLVFYVVRYRRALVRKNITSAFPSYNDQEIRNTEKRFYRHLTDYMVESAAMIRLNKKDYAKRFQFINLDYYHSFLDKGKNVLLISGHYGNWEWTCCLPLFSKYPIYAVYQAQSSRFFDEAMLIAREKNGMLLISYSRIYKTILMLQPGNTVAVYLLADQRPEMEKKPNWIEFLNRPVTYFRGLENLDKVMDGVVLYLEILKSKRGHYTVEFIPLKIDSDSSNEAGLLTRKYFEKLENNIRIDPAYYLWSHNRWKFLKPDSEESPMD